MRGELLAHAAAFRQRNPKFRGHHTYLGVRFRASHLNDTRLPSTFNDELYHSPIPRIAPRALGRDTVGGEKGLFSLRELSFGAGS